MSEQCVSTPLQENVGYGNFASGIVNKNVNNVNRTFVNRNAIMARSNVCCNFETRPVSIWEGGTSSSMLLQTNLESKAVCDYSNNIVNKSQFGTFVPESTRILNIVNETSTNSDRFAQYKRRENPVPCPPLPPTALNSTQPHPMPYKYCVIIPGYT
jgi:hypothetical protein